MAHCDPRDPDSLKMDLHSVHKTLSLQSVSEPAREEETKGKTPGANPLKADIGTRSSIG